MTDLMNGDTDSREEKEIIQRAITALSPVQSEEVKKALLIVRTWEFMDAEATQTPTVDNTISDLIERLARESQMLHERFDRYGLEVVMQGDHGHYVSPAIKEYINQLTKQVAKLKRRPSVAAHNALQEESDLRMVAIRAMQAKIDAYDKKVLKLGERLINNYHPASIGHTIQYRSNYHFKQGIAAGISWFAKELLSAELKGEDDE